VFRPQRGAVDSDDRSGRTAQWRRRQRRPNQVDAVDPATPRDAGIRGRTDVLQPADWTANGTGRASSRLGKARRRSRARERQGYGGTTLTCSPASAGTGAGRSARMPMALRDAGFKAGPPGARCRGELPGATDLMPAPFVLSDFTAPAAGRSARPSRAKLCCTETAAISATARAISFNPDSFAAFCSSMIFSENRIPLLRIML